MHYVSHSLSLSHSLCSFRPLFLEYFVFFQPKPLVDTLQICKVYINSEVLPDKRSNQQHKQSCQVKHATSFLPSRWTLFLPQASITWWVLIYNYHLYTCSPCVCISLFFNAHQFRKFCKIFIIHLDGKNISICFVSCEMSPGKVFHCIFYYKQFIFSSLIMIERLNDSLSCEITVSVSPLSLLSRRKCFAFSSLPFTLIARWLFKNSLVECNSQ